MLVDDASFRVGEGTTAALVGPNGAGKTTLIRLIAGDISPQSGTVAVSGGLGVMRQFVGGIRGAASPGLGSPASPGPGSPTSPGPGSPGASGDPAAPDPAGPASGQLDTGRVSGASPVRDLLISAAPPRVQAAAARLEAHVASTAKTVPLVSHERESLANCAERIVTVEDGSVWVHGGGFATYAQARRDRIERLDELRRRWDEEHEKIKQLVRMYRQKASYNDAMASRLQAAETRLRKFEEAGPPELPPRDQNVRMRLRGGRTGKRAVICENLELIGLMRPFSVEVWYGERVAVLVTGDRLPA